MNHAEGEGDFMLRKEAMKSTRGRMVRVSVLAILAGMLAPAAHAGLSLPGPLTFGAGPLGSLDVQGVASAYGFYQDNVPAVSGLAGKHAAADISNGMVIVQKESGLVQFYLQAGAYSFPTVGVPFASAGSVTGTDFGALPVGYVKIVPDSSFSVEIGKLPTLFGAESGFTYQNINIQRGLLWNVEPVVSRGIQFNYSSGPLTASVSWNDGYYSNRYNWISGLVSYALDSANTVSFYGGGNLGGGGGAGSNSYSNANIADGANDSDMYGVIYSYSSGPWTVTPYVQYMYIPAQPGLGITKASDNWGASVLANYSITGAVSLGGRVEYLAASGTPGDGSAAGSITGFGNGAAAWTFTVTPTYQSGGFFARAELSYVRAARTAGFTGFSGTNKSQFRGLLETGFMF